DSVIPLRIPFWERLPVTPSGLLILMIFAPVLAAAASRQSSTVPVCRGVSLSASYLAAIGPSQIPGFEFSLINSTDRMIRLQRPVPTSSHWYALTGGRWLWRASNGAGGSLADATNERSRLVVYRNSQSGGSAGSFVVQPHETRRWLETEIENPVLAYKPGCPLCSYPGERDYRVIFAYAYLPPQSEDAGGLLSCGIRSGPVPMPPRKQADDHPTGSWSSSEGEEPLGGDQLDPSQPAPRSGVPRE
ncbi:MAG TPA: hypothetical protein VGR96_17720, partial [Acidobacteriaceae bacterium]|nr:hypothetical protein [Acidobacteriaceae bacterium]